MSQELSDKVVVSESVLYTCPFCKNEVSVRAIEINPCDIDIGESLQSTKAKCENCCRLVYLDMQVERKYRIIGIPNE